MTGADVRYHPRDRCTYCGAHVLRCRVRVLVEHKTCARALACIDTMACLRRQKFARDRMAA